MKICILTQPLHSNYGGLLQAFALQTILKRMGHRVWTVDWAHDLSYWRWALGCCRTLILRVMKRNVPFPVLPYRVKYMRRYTDRFIFSNITTTVPMHSISTRKLNPYEFDAYVVGSDQVWRLAYNAHIEWMYLSFVKDAHVRRLAYAASIGIEHWDYPEPLTKLCAALAQRFDGISVREKEAVALVQDNLGMSSQYVLDPTLLLDADDYAQLLSLPVIRSGRSIAIYILDMNVQISTMLESLCEQMQCELHVIGNPKAQDTTCNYKERQSPPVEDWINGIRSAEYVVTDSFHGTVFSILFHKSFICLGNERRGMSRFTSLLEMAGLTARLVNTSYLNVESIASLLHEEIDWMAVDARKKVMQQISVSFLKSNLGL